MTQSVAAEHYGIDKEVSDCFIQFVEQHARELGEVLADKESQLTIIQYPGFNQSRVIQAFKQPYNI